MSDRNSHPSLKPYGTRLLVIGEGKQNKSRSTKEMWQTNLSLLAPHAKLVKYKAGNLLDAMWRRVAELSLNQICCSVHLSLVEPSLVSRNLEEVIWMESFSMLRIDSARADAWRDNPSRLLSLSGEVIWMRKNRCRWAYHCVLRWSIGWFSSELTQKM